METLIEGSVLYFWDAFTVEASLLCVVQVLLGAVSWIAVDQAGSHLLHMPSPVCSPETASVKAYG
jgi:hypothetical protein